MESWSDSNEDIMNQLFKSAQQLEPQIIKLYRDLHHTPQIGLQEYQTSVKVRQYLSTIDGLEIFPPITEVPTAVIARFGVSNASQSILIRCQLDALPLKQASGLSFASENGLHHACGHDGHMAMVLVAARIIGTKKNFLKRNLTFCFQPGQQGKRGAQQLFKCYPSLLEGIDSCYALHSDNSAPNGTLKLVQGPVTALSARFSVNLMGKSAHCMSPQEGIDANFFGCSLVSQLYGLTSTSVAPLQGSSLVIYKVEGGSNMATVSNNFRIMGSVRTFSMATYERLRQRITKLSEGVCVGYGGSAEVDFGEVSYRPVINDSGLVKRLKRDLQRNGRFVVMKGNRSFAGQDFCEFSQRRASCYMNIGTALPESIDPVSGESLFPLHSPVHKLEEKALLVGVRLWLLIAFR